MDSDTTFIIFALYATFKMKDVIIFIKKKIVYTVLYVHGVKCDLTSNPCYGYFLLVTQEKVRL